MNILILLILTYRGQILMFPKMWLKIRLFGHPRYCVDWCSSLLYGSNDFHDQYELILAEMEALYLVIQVVIHSIPE